MSPLFRCLATVLIRKVITERCTAINERNSVNGDTLVDIFIRLSYKISILIISVEFI